MAWLSLAALVVVGFLGWNLYRRFASDRIAALIQRRQMTSRLVSRGEFVDGNRHLPVALSVEGSTLFYENSDMDASLDLHWVREIEYDTALSTGAAPPQGRVLRLRSDSQLFEFVIPSDIVAKWHVMLPPRRAIQPAVAK